ncbi:MAG: GNAT family N-acetyltransferase [Planctomycetes bacterium]|nr:GNAT family N-acetyltransferase [Planctomycetota bacterium]
MKLTLRTLSSLSEALALTPLCDAVAADFQRQISDHELAPGTSERFLRAHFQARETVCVVAEGPERAWGVCLTGPFVDPLLGTTQPMVLVLHVDPALRHRGVATELVREAERVLRERGATTLAARATHNDDALISMGERWGFVRAWELMVRE